MRFLISIHPCQHVFLSVFFILAILVGEKWYLFDFICIALIANNVDHNLMCLQLICVSSLEKYLCSFFNWVICHFIVEL